MSHDKQNGALTLHCSGLVTTGHEATPVLPCAGVLASDSCPTAFSLVFLWKFMEKGGGETTARHHEFPIFRAWQPN